MQMSDQQMSDLHQDGFIILPDLFTVEEVDALAARVPALWAEDTPANIREKSSNEVRMALALHQRDSLFSKLVYDPRLVDPAMQILNEPFYIQQTKVNNKAPMSSEIWQWHHDFGNHRVNDDVEKPLALNIHLFLDDISHFNGPLCFIPGSHTAENERLFDHPVEYDDQTSSFAVWAVTETVIEDNIARAARRQSDHGIVAATGGRGTALIFFDTTIHCSPANFSPWKRSVFSMIVNPISNAYRNAQRPDYLHHKDLTPVVARRQALVA